MVRTAASPAVAERLWEDLELQLDPAAPAARPLRILFATDGSEDALAAERLLARIPLPDGSTIQAVTVCAEPDWHVPEALRASQREWMESLSREAADRASRPGVDVRHAVRYGAVGSQVLAAAEEYRAELIVLGCRGLSELERFLVGSVTWSVARHAEVPVLVARAPAHELRTVLLGVDESQHSEDAVRFLARLPLPAETRVLVTHVVRPLESYVVATPEYYPGWEEAVEACRVIRRRDGERLVARAAELLERAGHRTEQVILEGNAANELLHLVAEREVDLTVVGARGVSLIQGLLMGSVADRVLGAGPGSVLIVHRPR